MFISVSLNPNRSKIHFSSFLWQHKYQCWPWWSLTQNIYIVGAGWSNNTWKAWEIKSKRYIKIPDSLLKQHWQLFVAWEQKWDRFREWAAFTGDMLQQLKRLISLGLCSFQSCGSCHSNPATSNWRKEPFCGPLDSTGKTSAIPMSCWIPQLSPASRGKLILIEKRWWSLIHRQLL